MARPGGNLSGDRRERSRARRGRDRAGERGRADPRGGEKVRCAWRGQCLSSREQSPTIESRLHCSLEFILLLTVISCDKVRFPASVIARYSFTSPPTELALYTSINR